MGNTTCEAYGDICPMSSTLKQLEAMSRSCYLLHNRRGQTTCTRQDLGHRPFRNTLSGTTFTNQKALLILPNSERLGSKGPILIYKM